MNLFKLTAILAVLLATTLFVAKVEGAEGDATGDNTVSEGGDTADESATSDETTVPDTEETTAFCDSVPSAEDIEFMGTFENYIPDCDNEMCPDETEYLDLSVLTFNMKCLRDACDSDAKQAGIDKCIKQLEIQQKNIFQFAPENYSQQFDKACSCNYDEITRYTTESDNPTTVCDATWVHNCLLPVNGKPCMNAMGILLNDGYCDSPDASKEKKAKIIEEKIEYFRVTKLCEPAVKSMLLGENIVKPRCRHNDEAQDKLILACDENCYYYPREGSFDIHVDYMDTPEDEGFYQYVREDYFNSGCDQFESEEGVNYYAGTVYYQGNRNVWWNMMDFCEEFRADGGTQPPKQLRFTPVTRNINPLDKLTKAFDKCCPVAGTYTPGTRELFSLAGKNETECMMGEGVFIDFGFIPSLIRGAIQRSSGLCYELYSTVTPCEEPAEGVGMPEELKCTDEVDLDTDQMELKSGRVSPSEVFWFLKYIPEEDQAVRASVLRGCADGAKMGRTVTVLPGLSLGLEAQKYANDKVPVGYQTHTMLAYHTCAVFASVHENKYFDTSEGVGCNDYALNPYAQLISDEMCYN